MTKRLKFWLISIICIVLLSMTIVGVVLVSDNDIGVEDGFYVRRIYGYIGTINSTEKQFPLTIYFVGKADEKLLDYSENTMFLGDDIRITDFEIKDKNKDGVITVYYCWLHFKILSESCRNYSELIIENNSTHAKLRLNIGEITLENVNGIENLIGHGASSNFIRFDEFENKNGEYSDFHKSWEYLTDIGKKEPVIVQDVRFSNPRISNITSNFPKTCVKESNFGVEEKIVFDVNIEKKDMLFISPIIQYIDVDGQMKYSHVIQPTKYEKRLTYDETVEYLKELSSVQGGI